VNAHLAGFGYRNLDFMFCHISPPTGARACEWFDPS
jgi:hypothetical protein